MGPEDGRQGALVGPSSLMCLFFSSRRRHTRYWRDWSSDVCSSDLAVTDGATHAVATTFFEVRDGRIRRATEYWPDPFPAAEWRAAWVERAPAPPAPRA